MPSPVPRNSAVDPALAPSWVPPGVPSTRPPLATQGICMTNDSLASARPAAAPDDLPLHGRRFGPLGRLGAWTAGHFRVVLLVWAVIAVALGAFAPKVEHALAGA